MLTTSYLAIDVAIDALHGGSIEWKH